jgi:vacuolar protein sorting-associated protein 53
MQDSSRPGANVKPATIASACLVVDVLGPEVRAHFVERYVTLELKEYRRIFRIAPTATGAMKTTSGTGSTEENEAAGLDNISRRFAWFRRLLATYDQEVARVFPPEWRVGWALVTRFADVTRCAACACILCIHEK